MNTKAALKQLPGPTPSQMLKIPEVSHKNNIFWSLDYPLELIKQYGGLIHIKAFKQIIVADASAIEYIFKTNAKNYDRNPLFYDKKMQPIFGKSLLTMEGLAWKQRRKSVLPAYHQTALKTYASSIIEETQKKLTHWIAKCPKKLNIFTETSLLTLKIAFKLFSSYEISDKSLRDFAFSVQFCTRYAAQAIFIHRWKPTLQNMRFFWHMKKIDTFILNIIQKRRQNANIKEDLLSLLLNTIDENTKKPLSDLDILSEFKSHIIPGHETTACCLSWMWYLLAKHPHYRTQMEAELDQVLNGALPTPDILQQLPLTKAIVSETLRLYPPIWTVPRTNIASDVINGYEIPAHSNLSINLYALHRNPSYWEYPNHFIPERFLESVSHRHAFSFLPFIAGTHTCIASHLGMLEAMLLTIQFAQKMRFELPKKFNVMPEPYISLRPKGGIVIHPICRLKVPAQHS